MPRALDDDNSGGKEPPGRVAGIDYGTVRIGVALTNTARSIASPLETYTRRTDELDAAHFRQLATDEQVALFVVGLPVHLDGHVGGKAAEAQRFGAWLSEVTGVPVVYFDERYTSVEAHEKLTAADLRGKRRKQRIDMLAAQILLEAYLESPEKAGVDPGGLDDVSRRRGPRR